MKKKTLNDVWEIDTLNGIFYILSTLSEVEHEILPPWFEYDVDIYGIDLDYHYNHSGNKYISPLLEHFLDADGHITTSNKKQIGRIIATRFFDKWKRVLDVTKLEYAPIENYDRQEDSTRTIDTDRTNTGTSDVDKTGTISTDDTGTASTDNDTTTTNYVESYNGGEKSDSKSVIDGTITTTNNLNNLQTFNTNDETTLNLADTEDTTDGFTSHIHGNIGVTTSQQMIQSEIDLWSLYDFWAMCYKDVDSILTLNVY